MGNPVRPPYRVGSSGSCRRPSSLSDPIPCDLVSSASARPPPTTSQMSELDWPTFSDARLRLLSGRRLRPSVSAIDPPASKVPFLLARTVWTSSTYRPRRVSSNSLTGRPMEFRPPRSSDWESLSPRPMTSACSTDQLRSPASVSPPCLGTSTSPPFPISDHASNPRPAAFAIRSPPLPASAAFWSDRPCLSYSHPEPSARSAMMKPRSRLWLAPTSAALNIPTATR